MDVRGFGRSETGTVREINQDRYWVGEASNIYVLADGLGGKSDGERASAALVNEVTSRAGELEQLLEEGDPTSDRRHRMRVQDFLEQLVQSINTKIYDAGEGDMGTTCELLAVSGDAAFIAHVGDSRTYLLRRGGAYQLTEDHTFAEQMRQREREQGREAEFVTEQYEHVLTRSVGGEPRVDTDTLFVDVQPGDRFLLCSDGVSDVVGGSEFRDVARAGPPESLADRVVERALEAGSSDNATSVVVAVGDSEREDFRDRAPVDTVRQISFLEQIDLFQGLEQQELLRILRIVYQRRVSSGETIIRRAEEDDQMYMLLEGTVSLQIEDEEITRLEPGAHFGEMALFGSGVRSADAIAVDDVVLLVVPSDQFRRLVEHDDIQLGNKLLRNLLEHAAQRIRETTMELLREREEADSKAEVLGRARTVELEVFSEEDPEDDGASS